MARKEGKVDSLPLIIKREVADKILNKVAELLVEVGSSLESEG